jgi:hypothetical protein
LQCWLEEQGPRSKSEILLTDLSKHWACNLSGFV